MNHIFTTLGLLIVMMLPLPALGAGSTLSVPDGDVLQPGPQPKSPSLRPVASDVSRKFILLRVDPLEGTNPFDFRDVQRDIAAAREDGTGGGSDGVVNACTQGPLTLTSGMPVVPPGDAYIDIDPATNNLTVRETGAAGPNTALVVSVPTMDTTRFAIGPVGWTASNPSLPQEYPAGAPAQTFVVRRTDSGDFYSLTVGFLGTSMLTVTSASGQCCGTGGCP